MRQRRRSIPFAVLLAAGSLAGPFASAGRAQEEPPAPETPAPAADPAADVMEQFDRKKTITMKLPRTWRAASGEDVDPNALATFKGFWGEESKGVVGMAWFFTMNQYGRAVLARAIDLPAAGPVRESSLRQGPGWAEGCFNSRGGVYWRRYMEKDGRVYMVSIAAPAAFHDSVKEAAQKLLDSATVTGDAPPKSLGAGWQTKKSGEFDVTTDAGPDRDSSLKHVLSLLTDGRQATAKALGGKPFDASRPAAWIFQNGQKYEDVAKAATGVAPDNATFNPVDRAAMVALLGENTQGFEESATLAGAQQYVSQYFGGTTPIWVNVGLATWGQYLAAGGGKKVVPETVTRVKSAVAAGKRRLDQWFDVKSWNEVTDNDQGARELFAWHWYFKNGKGSKKYKKQYEGYLQTLRESGDPVAARKQFDGVDFDAMLQDFKSWASEWKP